MLITVVLCVAIPRLGSGGEAKFPTPSYKADELAKVKEWEKNWVGKRIDESNVDQVTNYIPGMYQESIKDSNKWGGKPMWFTIVPYRQVVPTRGFVEATRKNKGKITTDESMIPVGYDGISGFPFPEPKTGWEVAWNYDFNNRGDSLDYGTRGFRVDRTTGLDSGSVIKNSWLWFVSRTEVSPKPRIPDKDNPRGVRWAFLMEFEHPQAMAGSRIMNYRYRDFSKDDESYMWMAEFRRVQKQVASQKATTDPGMERCMEDHDGFNNHITANDYRLLGRKELLVARHIDPDQWVRVSGQYLWSGVQRERVNTYVVEAIPKDTNHVYSKRIWYVDPEDFFIKWVEGYDREGKLWRLLENQYGVYKNANEEDVSFLAGTADLEQKGMAAAANVSKPRKISAAVNPTFFTLEGMRKATY
jgi:hypothetical protein